MELQDNYKWALGRIGKQVKDHINIVSTLTKCENLEKVAELLKPVWE